MIPEEKVDRFSAAAKPYYSDSLPYHNWSHAQSVMEQVDILCNRVQLRTQRVARGALHVAAAWHDAGFHEDHLTLGFETKEHYSAELAENYLKANEIGETTRRIVRAAILGTIHMADRSDINALILHRADIANIGGEYSGFLNSNIKLWHEQRLYGALEWAEWQASSAEFATFAAEESRKELPRLGERVGTSGSFDMNALHNAQQLLLEPQPQS